MKMEVAPSSELSLNIYQTTWRHISEDNTLQSHQNQNLTANFSDEVSEKIV
jgi:hypothetical protein